MAIEFAPATNEESISYLEDGRYLLKARDAEETPDNGYGPGIKWYLQVASQGNDGKWHAVMNSDGTAYELWHFTNKPKEGQAMGPRNKTRQLIEAVIGRTLNEGEKVTADQVFGKPFFGLLGPKLGQDGKTHQRILSVTPYKPGAPASAPVAPPEPVAASTEDPFA